MQLQDAHFHIRIHPEYLHFFHFAYKVHQFQSVSFGLASSPLIVTNTFVAPFLDLARG
jgi:hypothetical protein